MKKKTMFFIFGIIVIIFMSVALRYPYYASNAELSGEMVRKVKEGSADAKKELIDAVLLSSKIEATNEEKQYADIAITYGKLTGKEEDLIITVQMSKKKSFIAVYKKKINNYEFVAIVDHFFKVDRIQFIEKKGNFLVVREVADQMLGAFEISTYIRVYRWDNESGKFRLVLNIQEDSKAYWNQLWDNNKPKEQGYWQLVTQKSNVEWIDGVYPVVRVVMKQAFWQSEQSNQVEIPLESTFDAIKTRELSETYYWNDDFKCFLLFEGVYKKTGEKVAVVSDLSHSPFALAGFEKDNYRLQFKDGKTEVVEYGAIMKK